MRLGVLNYYKSDAACAPVQANPLAYAYSDVIDCLNINKQDVPALGSKFNLRPVAGNLVTVANSFGQRVETIRGADDLHPTFETTNKMTYMKLSDSTYDLGPRYWNTEIWDPSWKFGDQHTFNDRWLVDVSFGHHCWCDSIVPQTDELRTVQPMLELTSGTWGRSWSDSSIMLVTNNTVDVASTYFFPGRWGGDHSFKAGFSYGHFGEVYDRPYSGHAQSGFQQPASAADLQHAVHGAGHPRLHHAGVPDQNSFYVQDTYSRKRLTTILGVRWDRQVDNVAADQHARSCLSGPADDRRDAVQPVPRDRACRPSAPAWSGIPWRRDSASPTT